MLGKCARACFSSPAAVSRHAAVLWLRPRCFATHRAAGAPGFGQDKQAQVLSELKVLTRHEQEELKTARTFVEEGDDEDFVAEGATAGEIQGPKSNPTFHGDWQQRGRATDF